MTLFARTLLDASTVTPPAAPVANPFSTSIVGNSTNNVMPLSITGTYTSVNVSTGASHGTASVSGSTSILYTPTSGYVGSDSFDYTATGPGGTSPPALASLTVTTPPFVPVTHTYTSGSGTETVPTGATNCTISVWAGGGGASSAGGGGAEERVLSIAVTGGNTMAYAVGSGGGGGVQGVSQPTAGTNSTVTGTVSGGSAAITAIKGGGALYTPTVGVGGTGGSGGTGTPGASGALPSGAGGNGGDAGGAPGTGGAGVSSGAPNNGFQPGGGGGGNSGASTVAGGGADGTISFAYT